MSLVATGGPARARVFQVRTPRHDRDHTATTSRALQLLEALSYAGALIDPSGILASQRFRRIQEERQRQGGSV